MPAIVIEATWAAAGGTVIIYLAALLGVPPELYDAAEVDGASIWQKIRHITLPHIRTVLFVTLILQLIATAQLFTEPLLFTGGGPANATLTVLLLIYRYAFQNSLGGDYGMAAALSLMLAAFLAVFTAGYYWLTRSWSRTHEAARAADAGSTPDAKAGPRDHLVLGLAAAAHQLAGRAPARRDARVPAHRRARAVAVDGQVVDHAHPGHAADADGPVAERLRPRAARDRLVADAHRPLPAGTRS